MVVNQYQEMLDPMVGTATKESFASSWGLPDRKESVGDLEIWMYRRSLGMKTNATINTQQSSRYHQYPNYSSSNTYEMYDEITLTFGSNGILKTWSCNVRR